MGGSPSWQSQTRRVWDFLVLRTQSGSTQGLDVGSQVGTCPIRSVGLEHMAGIHFGHLEPPEPHSPDPRGVGFYGSGRELKPYVLVRGPTVEQGMVQVWKTSTFRAPEGPGAILRVIEI